jgi:hypothetical protein
MLYWLFYTQVPFLGMANASSLLSVDNASNSSDSEQDKSPKNKKRNFKNDHRRQTRPQRYRDIYRELGKNPSYREWLQPVPGTQHVKLYLGLLTRKCFVENPEKTHCIACKSEYKAGIIVITG